jgi:hypothetical protein
MIHMERDAAEWAAELRSPDWMARTKALEAIPEKFAGSNCHDPQITDAVLDMLKYEEPWVVRMHLARALPFVVDSEGHKPEVYRYLFDEAQGKNKFVRAWSLDALSLFAVQDESIRERVLGLLDEALTNGSAAIKVRARRGLNRLA